MIKTALQDIFISGQCTHFIFTSIKRFKITENRETKKLYTGTQCLLYSVGQEKRLNVTLLSRLEVFKNYLQN